MTIPLSKLQPALLKSKEVATLHDVENVDTKIENVLNGSLPLDEAAVGGTKLLDYIDSSGTSIYSGTDHKRVTTMQDGDLFIESTYDLDSLGNNVPVTKTYRYDTNHWVNISNNATLTALRDVSDGKRTVFTTTSAPNPPYQKGDIWYKNGIIKVSKTTRLSGSAVNSDWEIGGDVTKQSIDKGIDINSGGINIVNGGSVKSNNFNIANNTGVFLGEHGGRYKFLAGNGNNYIKFDGTNLKASVNSFTMNGGYFKVQSNTSGQRTVITHAGLSVYDSNNVLRVVVGSL